VLRPYPIETERLVLRAFSSGDFDDLYAIQSDPEVARYLYWGPRDAEEVRRSLAEKIEASVLQEEGEWLSLAVVLRRTGRLVGDMNLRWLSREHRQGEIGFSFNPAYQGQGLATEAAEAMLSLGFEGLELHRIIGRCEARNVASARLMERLGMRLEAHFVENEFVKGRWDEELVYAMLDREWRERRGR
jgi:RimJ/RimL family protein N-acetyltransferase